MQSLSPQQQILTLIHKMRTSQVSQAEEQLMTLVNNPHFMQTIFGIIKNQHLQPWIKTISSTFLNRVICQKLQQLGYKTMFAAISNIMSSYDISATDKRCFQRSLISLIEYIKQPQEIQEWQTFISNYINDPRLFDTGLLLISCTAVAEISTDYLCMIIETTYEETLKKLSVNIQNSYGLNQLLKNWIVVFDKLKTVNEDDQYVTNVMKNMCKSPNLAKLLYSIYHLQSPAQVWLCLKSELHELNLLKYEAAQLNRKIIQHAISIELTALDCPSLNIIYEFYNTIKNTIAIVGTNLKILQNYQCQEFVTSLFGLLVGYIKSNGNLIKEQMQVLMHIICYPFLKTRDEEMYIFEQSPVEFNSLMQDLCDKQQFGILKTEAARLLQTIGDFSQSALQSSIRFCVQCIKMKMGFVPLIESQQIRVLDIEVAFQILSIHSFSLDKYSTTLQALKIILLDKRLMQVSPLQISKIFLLLAYNYGQVFKNVIDGTIWIDYALNYKMHPTSRYMAFDFLSNISDEYFSENFFNSFVQLINTGQQRESGQIWSIVGKIFDHQKSKINQNNCLNLVNHIFLRIQNQVTKISEKKKQSTLDIVNGLHILRKIIQDTQYIISKQNLLKRIFDITIIYNKMIQFNIEDEIIKIVTEYLKVFKDNVPNEVYLLLPDIVQQFKKTEYHEKPYLILFNQIIIKGEYQKIKQILKILLSGLMFHLFDMSSKAQKLKQKVVIANILTLLQNFIPIHGYQMSKIQDNCFCEIEAMCMRLFPSQKQQKIFSKQLLAKALNLMLLCHIYNKTQNTIGYLILYAKQNIFHKYDAYVLIKLLTKAVFSEQNIQIVIEYLNLMIDITNQEQNNAKKSYKTAKTAKGKLRLKRQQELNKILQQIISPFVDFQHPKNQKYPLKKQVQDCIMKMKSQNLQTYKLIIMNMNEQKKTKLTTLLNQVTEVQGKNRVIRKVIGVKQNISTDKKFLNQDDNQNLEEEQPEQNGFKRTRLMKKKKQSKKRINEQIAEE